MLIQNWMFDPLEAEKCLLACGEFDVFTPSRAKKFWLQYHSVAASSSRGFGPFFRRQVLSVYDGDIFTCVISMEWTCEKRNRGSKTTYVNGAFARKLLFRSSSKGFSISDTCITETTCRTRFPGCAC